MVGCQEQAGLLRLKSGASIRSIACRLCPVRKMKLMELRARIARSDLVTLSIDGYKDVRKFIVCRLCTRCPSGPTTGRPRVPSSKESKRKDAKHASKS